MTLDENELAIRYVLDKAPGEDKLKLHYGAA